MATEEPASRPDEPMPDAAEAEAEATDDRTPTPPLPASKAPPVVAATPGPRATRLRAVYAQALEHTLGRLAWDNVASCYPTISTRAEGVLRQVQGQMVGKLGEKCGKEFESILAARQVVPKLNELEGLVADAGRRRREGGGEEPTPPHLLPPDRILAAHLHPALAAHQSQLNARLQTTQSQNAILHDEIRQQREEIEELLAQLEATVGDVKGANAALADVVGQLAVEAREGRAAVAAAAGAAGEESQK